jgi:hypothetical protein
VHHKAKGISTLPIIYPFLIPESFLGVPAAFKSCVCHALAEAAVGLAALAFLPGNYRSKIKNKFGKKSSTRCRHPSRETSSKAPMDRNAKSSLGWCL